MANRTYRTTPILSTLLATAFLAGCSSFGPSALQQSRLQYNEVVKTTTEQQLLLNIVRLRYTDTPSSLADIDRQPVAARTAQDSGGGTRTMHGVPRHGHRNYQPLRDACEEGGNEEVTAPAHPWLERRRCRRC